ncbi:MAG: hypothetical protein ACK40O_04975 [Allosphingosinicella sp.]
MAAMVPLGAGPATANDSGIKYENVYYDSTYTTVMGRWIMYCDRTTSFTGQFTEYMTEYYGTCW